MKPICVPCQRFYRPKKNGYYFLEGMPTTNVAGLGKYAAGWVPYKLWVGDLWECPDCHAQTVVGVASSPIAEHYQPGFSAAVESTGATRLLVKDC